MAISDKLKEYIQNKIKEECNDNGQIEYYVDYRDKIDSDILKEKVDQYKNYIENIPNEETNIMSFKEYLTESFSDEDWANNLYIEADDDFQNRLYDDAPDELKEELENLDFDELSNLGYNSLDFNKYIDDLLDNSEIKFEVMFATKSEENRDLCSISCAYGSNTYPSSFEKRTWNLLYKAIDWVDYHILDEDRKKLNLNTHLGKILKYSNVEEDKKMLENEKIKKAVEEYFANNFIDDKEKMDDMFLLSKDEFLNSYSYLTEESYDNTVKYLVVDALKIVNETLKNSDFQLGIKDNKFTIKDLQGTDYYKDNTYFTLYDVMSDLKDVVNDLYFEPLGRGDNESYNLKMSRFYLSDKFKEVLENITPKIYSTSIDYLGDESKDKILENEFNDTPVKKIDVLKLINNKENEERKASSEKIKNIDELEMYKKLSKQDKNNLLDYSIYNDIYCMANINNYNISDVEVNRIKDLTLTIYLKDDTYGFSTSKISDYLSDAVEKANISLDTLERKNYYDLLEKINEDDFNFDEEENDEEER